VDPGELAYWIVKAKHLIEWLEGGHMPAPAFCPELSQLQP
jgi:hypothetical protein